MKSVLLFLGMLTSLLVEYGALHSANGWPSLIPLTASIGLAVAFRLHLVHGLLWFLAAGIAMDIHATHHIGDVFIAAALGLTLSVLLRHYVTHASLYAAGLIAAVTLSLWGALRGAVLWILTGPPDHALTLVLWTPLLGAVTVVLLLLLHSYLRTFKTRWLLIH